MNLKSIIKNSNRERYETKKKEFIYDIIFNNWKNNFFLFCFLSKRLEFR